MTESIVGYQESLLPKKLDQNTTNLVQTDS